MLSAREYIQLDHGHEDSPTVHVHEVSAENVNREPPLHPSQNETRLTCLEILDLLERLATRGEVWADPVGPLGSAISLDVNVSRGGLERTALFYLESGLRGGPMTDDLLYR